jgi:hypothetical protein
VIYFVDFEASALTKGSFPIEIAWVDQLGHGESYLIRPSEAWLDGGRGWSFQSEKIHGISLPMLLTDGVPIELAARRAWEVLTPITALVASDAPEFDGYWLGMLLAAGDIQRTPALLHANDLYRQVFRPLLDALPPGDEAARKSLGDWAAEVVRKADETAVSRQPVKHRALADASRLRETWLAVKKAVDREMQERGL